MTPDGGDEARGAGAAARALGAELKRATADLRAADTATRALSRAVGQGLRGALDRAVFDSAKLGDALRSVAAELSRASLRAAVAPVGEAAGRGVARLAGGAVSALIGAGAASGVRAFAKGGVLTGPAAFPLGGSVGVAGEAGPEAILPLGRRADGTLGVRGGGGVVVNLNVSTPDVGGFRRSGPQIASELARAVARGRRGL